MIARILLIYLALSPWLPPGWAQASKTSDLAEVIDHWHSSYRRKQFGLLDPARQTGENSVPLYGTGHLPDNQRPLTHDQALSLLLEKASNDQQLPTLLAVLHLSTLGYGEKTRFDRPSLSIRQRCQHTLARRSDSAGQDLLFRVAQGQLELVPRAMRGTKLQAAAIEALGGIARPVFRPVIEAALEDTEPLIQRSAARALGKLARSQSLSAIAKALRGANDNYLARELVTAALDIYSDPFEKPSDSENKVMFEALLASVGSHDWQTDLRAVELLSRYRNPRAVSALISILERFPKAVKPSQSRELFRKNSGILRQRTHQVLTKLTGAIISAHDPERWRKHWDKVGIDFDFSKTAREKETTGRTKGSFFGIPVSGDRVVFLIDTSGSMNDDYQDLRQSEEQNTRLVYAKRELKEAVNGLLVDTRFNVILFSENARAWRNKLVEPSDTNRSALTNMLTKVNADGSTNLFAALEAGLHLRASRSGKRYVSPVDEIFVLSDGEPTIGEPRDKTAILEAVREINRSLLIRINAIYLGENDSDFLQLLAKENNGRYRRL